MFLAFNSYSVLQVPFPATESNHCQHLQCYLGHPDILKSYTGFFLSGIVKRTSFFAARLDYSTLQCYRSRYMAEIIPTRRRPLHNQSINQSISAYLCHVVQIVLYRPSFLFKTHHISLFLHNAFSTIGS